MDALSGGVTIQPKATGHTGAQIKQLSALGRAINSRVKAEFYRLGQHLLFFNSDSSKRCKFLAQFYRERAFGAMAGKAIFKDFYVGYSLNVENRETLGVLPEPDKTDRVFSRAKDHNPHVTQRAKYGKTGLCWAASAHCARKFFNNLSDLDGRDAFCKAVERYEEGMPEKDALVQKMLTEKHSSVPSKPKVGKMRPEGKAQVQQEKLMKEDSRFAHFFHLDIAEHNIMRKGKFPREIAEADQGVYLMSLVHSSNYSSGHVILMIKNSDESLSIFDPSVGAAIVPKDEIEACLNRLVYHKMYRSLNWAAFAKLTPQ